jgi:hypothetical protein
LLALCSLCVQFLSGQQSATPVTGWYNGAWKPAIPGTSNWYASDQQFGRVYDDFIVPDPGWTVVGLFSNNSMTPDGVSEAVWEIRTGVSSGNGGTLFASGRGPATLTQGQAVGNGVYTYRVQVDGLTVQLPPGWYWLSVTPVTSQAQTYVCATLGADAIGQPPGNNGGAFYYSPTSKFSPVQSTGQGGTSGDFSLGVLITPAPVSRDSAWRNDITSLAQQMPALHSVPFPGVSLADFNSAASDLSTRISALSDAQVRTALQALVASIGDPHTDIAWPSPRPFQILPLSFYWFDDGVYVIAAPNQYKELLGGRVTRVGDYGIDNAIDRLTPLIAHDNDSWLKYLLPSKLTNADFLYGTGVADSTTSVEIQVQNPHHGGPASARGPAMPPVRPRSMRVEAVADSQLPPMLPVYHGPLPLSRQHPERHYWAIAIDNGATVYFQYNSCSEDPAQSSADFFGQLAQLLAQPGIARLIVDMRNNTGGSATILDPWIESLKSTRFNQSGRLYVIVGRATFSAAMEASDLLHDGTAAIFVGEPTGGKPRFLLRRGDFPLPYFGLRVSYSSGNEHANDPGPTLTPDLQTPVTFSDYMRGLDRALDAILDIPAPKN